MYLLDTNVISMLDARRRAHAPELVDWLRRNGASLFLSAMSITELKAGVLKLRREGKTARANEVAALVTNIVADFEHRVLPMDVDVAKHVARLSEASYSQPIDLPDLIIAATAARHGLTVLTRNLAHFSRLGVPADDPFVDLPPDI